MLQWQKLKTYFFDRIQKLYINQNVDTCIDLGPFAIPGRYSIYLMHYHRPQIQLYLYHQHPVHLISIVDLQLQQTLLYRDVFENLQPTKNVFKYSTFKK